MTLTGPWTVALCVLACLTFPLILFVCWNRGGRRWQAWLFRAVLIIASQLSAVVLIAVLLNDSYDFYGSWQELAGAQRPHMTSPSVVPGSQDQTLRPRIVRAARTGHGAIVWLTIPGLLSRAGTHPAVVYLPPQYGEPAYRNRTFPVVELLSGYPGHPRNWVDQAEVATVLDQAIDSGHVSPLIAVMPTSIVAPPRDTECVNVPGGPQAETYLTTDVPSSVTHSFRAQPTTTGWAVMGYSTGGYCAVNLALRHPDRFRAAVSLSGYNAPAHDHTTGDLFGGSSLLRDQNTTIWRVRHLPRPVLNLLLMDTRDDKESFQDDQALAAAAIPPIRVSVLSLAHGGHNFTTWHADEITAFAWLSIYLTPPLAPIPAIDGQTPSFQRPAHRRHSSPVHRL